MIGRLLTGRALIFAGSVLASGPVSRIAPGMWPASYSAGSRASTNSAALAAKNFLAVTSCTWIGLSLSGMNGSGTGMRASGALVIGGALGDELPEVGGAGVVPGALVDGAGFTAGWAAAPVPAGCAGAVCAAF